MLTLKRNLAGWLQCFPPLRWGLKFAAWLWAPRQHVGAVGAVFNRAGQVLLVEHVFRPGYNWGLPGGWVERGENPADAVRRELKEELGLKVEVKQILLCETQGDEAHSSTPLGLGLAYYCRLANEQQGLETAHFISHTFEILSCQWVDPQAIARPLPALAQKAITLAQQEFEREQETGG
ncbi:MAG: NUDIX hydrolase [Anaerolineae bacterium]|nr:NUDIX hydrolase [Anaerolineae bacterium]